MPKDPTWGRNTQCEANTRANDPTAGRSTQREVEQPQTSVNPHYQFGFNTTIDPTTVDAIVPQFFTMLP